MKDIFLELPMVGYQYPEDVYKLAKRAGVKPEDIAERDKIEPEPVVQLSHLRFDLIVNIVLIQDDHTDQGNRSIAYYSDGNLDIFQINHRKLAKKIKNFLNKNEIEYKFGAEIENVGNTQEEDREDDFKD